MIDEKKLIKEIEELPFIHGRYDKENAPPDFISGVEFMYEIISELIKQQPKVGEWIPCSKRLPDEGKEVLISYDYDSFDIEMTPKRYLGVMIGCYEDSEWWSSDEWTDGVTAWYPLPEPWEGEE